MVGHHPGVTSSTSTRSSPPYDECYATTAPQYGDGIHAQHLSLSRRFDPGTQHGFPSSAVHPALGARAQRDGLLPGTLRL